MIETVGLIGSGAVAKAMARHLLGNGVSVLMSNSRGPSTLAEVVEELGAGARAVDVVDLGEDTGSDWVARRLLAR
jgi:3-hydroxyisobutyrate dehydrogenase-like beta-hydroxyacid dehydrogenase